MTHPLVFIGDRPAQFAALVLDAPLTYTGDRLNPFKVMELVEAYILDGLASLTASQRATQPHAAHETTTIILSTGLGWAPRYTGMARQQLRLLTSQAVAQRAPRGARVHVFVMPVSSRLLLGDTINRTLRQDICRSKYANYGNAARFLGDHWRFSGDTTYPSQPTPAEVMTLFDVINPYP